MTLSGCRPDEAVGCMSVASSAYLNLNQRDQAQAAAEQYLVRTRRPRRIDRRAQQLLDTIKRTPEVTSPPAPRQQELDDSDSPTKLVHKN